MDLCHAVSCCVKGNCHSPALLGSRDSVYKEETKCDLSSGGGL